MTLEFGQVVHVSGIPFAVVWERNGQVMSVDVEGRTEVCAKEHFDEFKPCPEQGRREKLLKLWRGQSLDFAHDKEHQSTTGLSHLLKWMEKNKDEIVSILTE